MSEKKPFIVGNWDDLFLTNKIRSLERRKKLNLYLATVGCMAFALSGAVIAKGAQPDSQLAILHGQRALWIAIGFAVLLLVSTLVTGFVWRTPDKVAMLQSSLIKGFGTALDSSDLNPTKKESKKGEVRT